MKPVQPPTEAQRFASRERPQGYPVMRQRWSELLFLHWPVAAEMIQSRLPAGLWVDTFGGEGWLGVVPFFMDRVRPSGLPALPWLSWFMELNVRTYVHDEAGNPGVWFFSLDCNQALAVEIARRLFHLPYQHAAMRSRRSGDEIHYRCRRKSGDAREAAFTYRVPVDPAPAVAGTLEWFLVERYRLFSCNRKSELFEGRVHHSPYQISPGKCDQWSADPLSWDGFAVNSEAPASILTAATVDVAVFPLRRCRS